MKFGLRWINVTNASAIQVSS